MSAVRKNHIYSFLLVLFFSGFSYGQIISAGSGSWNSVTSWVGGVIPKATDDVIIAASHIITLDISNAACNNLTINGIGATLRFAINGIPAGITVNGNILVNSGGLFHVENRSPAAAANSYYEHTLTLFGNLTNKGVFDMRAGSTSGGTSNGAHVVFAGTANSLVSLQNKLYLSASEEFNNVTINKTGGARVILTSGNLFMVSSATVGPAYLTFQNGIIETGTNIWVLLTTSNAGIIGGSASCYVDGALGRGMNSSAAANKKFEIGDADGYRPITVYCTNGGLASGHYVYVRLNKGDANTGGSLLTGGIDTVSRIHYYTVGYSTGGVATASPSMGFSQFAPTYNIDDGVTQGNNDLRVAYSSDSRATWTNAGPTGVTIDLSNPPTAILSTALSTPVVLSDNANLQVCLAHATGGNSGSVPTLFNAKYGASPSHQFDFWKASSSRPTPLLVYIHGGGFTSGDKTDISNSLVVEFISRGISVMSINYRFAPEIIVPNHYYDCARAIQYARFHAKELNIDPAKIGAGGSSAGGCASYWLGFHDDLADPLNADSVLRMSSRLSCVAIWSGQSCVDPRILTQWIGPAVLEFSYYTQGTIFGLTAAQIAIPDAHADSLFKIASPITFLTKDDAPVWAYYSTVDTATTGSQGIHHINMGYRLKDLMDPLGIECIIKNPSTVTSSSRESADFFQKYFNKVTGIKENKPAQPGGFILNQNFPNPFNPSTTISFVLPVDISVKVSIYNQLGEKLVELANGPFAAGNHTIEWNASGYPSGIYFYELRTDKFTSTRKLIVLK